MKSKLVFLCALSAALVGIVILLILRPPTAALPAIAETIIGALIGLLGVGGHAVFRETSDPPTTPAIPAQPKVN